MAEYSPYTTSHDTIGTSTLADNSSAHNTLSDFGSFVSDDFTSNLFAIVAQNKPITRTKPTQTRKVLVPKRPSSHSKRSTEHPIRRITVDTNTKSIASGSNVDDRTSDLIAALVAKRPSVEDAPESPSRPMTAPVSRPETALLPEIDESELGSPINESTPEKRALGIEAELAEARAIIADQARTIEALRMDNTALREDHERKIQSLTERSAEALTEHRSKMVHAQETVNGLKAELARTKKDHATSVVALESNLRNEHGIAAQSVEAEVEELNAKIVRLQRNHTAELTSTREQIRLEHGAATQAVEAEVDKLTAEIARLEKEHATELVVVRDRIRAEYGAATMHVESAVADLNAKIVCSDRDLKAANQRTEHYKKQVTQLRNSIFQKDQELGLKEQAVIRLEQEVVQLQLALGQKEQVEKEMDKHLTRDLRVMIKERDRMKQALMHAWAEKECPGEYGPDGRKVYKYKFVRKQGI